MLVQPDSTRQPLTLKKVKDEGREGIYVEQFTALQEGDYRIELQHPSAGDQLLVREVRVKIPAKETEFPERNDALLRDIADKTRRRLLRRHGGRRRAQTARDVPASPT